MNKTDKIAILFPDSKKNDPLRDQVCDKSKSCERIKNEQEVVDAMHEQEATFSRFLSKWWKVILYVVTGAALVIFFSYQFFFSPSEEGMSAFLEAKSAMEKLKYSDRDFGIQNGATKDKETLDDLKNILHKSPRLQMYYDAPLANELSFKSQWEDMEPFATSALKQDIQAQAPYKIYSETSLLIGKKEYAKALASTLKLHGIIENKSEFRMLNGYNLLRLASLYRQLGQFDNEKDAWSLWEKFAADETNKQEVLQIEAVFQEGSCCLKNFPNWKVQI